MKIDLNKVQLIWTHRKPHADERAAIRWIRLFSGRKIPVVYELPDEHEALASEDREEKGVFSVGIGGGRWDEHATADSKRKGRCAAELVARDLGIEKDVRFSRTINVIRRSESGEWQALIERIRERGDKRIASEMSHFRLSSLVRKLNELHPDDFEKVQDWFEMACAAEELDQERFRQGQQAFDPNLIREAETPAGKIKIFCGECSDDSKTHSAAFSAGASVAIVRRAESRQTQIFKSARSKISLSQVVVQVRLAEAAKRGVSLAAGDASGEFCAAVPQWYYQQSGAERIFNGSTTKPLEDKDISLLSLEELAQIVSTYAEAA